MKKLIIGVAVVVVAVVTVKKCKSECAGQWTDGPTISVKVEDLIKANKDFEEVGF